ncbi:hypothetical protein ACERK3_17390 [Phycisphaerales bacterium AB-hyl4]|uniref:Apea-like HEPN domain-containing protein n=1 Tax=Natronomicrosphaera hydrolytica TaxID=3242702 RepID=A0ABV4U9T3_9BACT
MRYKDDELVAGYTAEEIEKLFFLRAGLDDLSPDEKNQLLAKLNHIGLAQIRLDTVHLLLCVMHEAREKDQDRFLNEVFFPWCGLRQQTRSHFEHIAAELVRIGSFTPGSTNESVHCANLYRHIVSDLFDPYLSLVVACFQFNEGSFTSMEVSDLGQAERSKYEYLAARVDGFFGSDPSFLAGYDPRVRNAMSHTGAAGVTYLPDRIVFKNIKRGNSPRVEVVEWTPDELQHRILQLLECLQSIEAAVEIFGLDIGEAIFKDFTTYSQFVLNALSPEQRTQLRGHMDEVLQAVRQKAELTVEQRASILMNTLSHNLQIRQMGLRNVRLRNNPEAVHLDVPLDAIDTSKDGELVTRACELARYAIVARAVFRNLFDTFVVVETNDEDVPCQLIGEFPGVLLDEYADEKAGLVDLLNDGKWWLDREPLGIEVDFDAVKQVEHSQAARPFPRKPR